MSNSLCCEQCGKTHFEVPIIEKPLRFCSVVKVYVLGQNNPDGREQDNICINCLQNEIEGLVGSE